MRAVEGGKSVCVWFVYDEGDLMSCWCVCISCGVGAL